MPNHHRSSSGPKAPAGAWPVALGPESAQATRSDQTGTSQLGFARQPAAPKRILAGLLLSFGIALLVLLSGEPTSASAPNSLSFLQPATESHHRSSTARVSGPAGLSTNTIHLPLVARNHVPPPALPCFESVNPALIVRQSQDGSHDPSQGRRSILLTMDSACPISLLEQRGPKVLINGQEMLSGPALVQQLRMRGTIRLDHDDYAIPPTRHLYIAVRDQHGNLLFARTILNLAETGMFAIPNFRNTETGATGAGILGGYELRVYHVDVIPRPDGTVTSSFDISDVIDVEDQCGWPDGILDPSVFIHKNAIDYGRCEGGPQSTLYEVHYPGPYPMVVSQVRGPEDWGMGLTLDFALAEIDNPPLFVVEGPEGHLDQYLLQLAYIHFFEVNVKAGDLIQPGTKVGVIGRMSFNTELHEGRQVKETLRGRPVAPDRDLPPIPYKLTLSEADGDRIESLINAFNASPP